MELEVKAEINPSEDPEKVIESIKNLFPDLEVEVSGDKAEGRSEDFKSLENFKNKLGLQAIRDSARSRMKGGQQGDSVSFYLNKQAAFVSKVSFSNGETPLGPIEVGIKSDDVDRFIDYIAPGREDRKD